MVSDPFDPERFVQAQRGVYDTALQELRAGRKRSHWIWFIFPQVAGLGMSATSRRYSLTGLEEARAYLAHPLLGQRLREATTALLAQRASASAVLGELDALKFRSSMTLFALADPAEPILPGRWSASSAAKPIRARGNCSTHPIPTLDRQIQSPVHVQPG